MRPLGKEASSRDKGQGFAGINLDPFVPGPIESYLALPESASCRSASAVSPSGSSSRTVSRWYA